jgi:hypothetical protein
MSAAVCSVNIKQGENIMTIGSDTWQGVLDQVAAFYGYDVAKALEVKMGVGIEMFANFNVPATTAPAFNQPVNTYATGPGNQPQSEAPPVWAQREAAPQPYVPPVPTKYCKDHPEHGPMLVKQGQGKNNKPYTRYNCSHGLCEVQWG